ncbi:response regulator [Cohnella sp. GCM10020058]|uniref:response regulator transcription factor n=1 Tax=Cohnella sp. GCM10020058 TaxID=3317330 RepID=UPI00363EDDC4
MLRAIIVDDERTTRDSLSRYLPWERMGVASIATAKNGLEALETAQAAAPDILLTDVRMPKMDGMELAAKIRAIYPSCKIIFLSGHADKQYLKEAIHLKAISFVEKPINVTELESALLKAIAECLDDRRHLEENQRMIDGLGERRWRMRQELARELTGLPPDPSELENRFGDLYIRFSRHPFFTAAYAIIDGPATTDNRMIHGLRSALLEQLAAPEVFGWADCLAGFDVRDRLFMIVAERTDRPAAERDAAIVAALRHLQECAADRIRLTLSVGPRVREIGQVPASFQAAIAAAALRFYRGDRNVIRYDAVPTVEFRIDSKTHERFRRHLSTDDRGPALALIRQLAAEAAHTEDLDLHRVKSVFYQLTLIVQEAAASWGIAHSDDGSEMHAIWRHIDRVGSLDELASGLLHRIGAMYDRIRDKDSVGRKVYEITQYIRAHYADSTLSTQSIALHVSFSKTYLCAFFKKNAGKTINEFITEVRMEKAKDLLKEGQLKQYEIADALGYKDANYFTTLFKKHTGYTPTRYMEIYYPVSEAQAGTSGSGNR